MRAHIIALQTNNRQRSLLSQHCGYARIAYNFCVDSHQATRDAGGKWPSFYDLKKQFNALKHERFPWCATLSQLAAKNAIHDFGAAFRNWKAGWGKAGRRAMKPTHRRRKGGRRYTASNGRNMIVPEGRRVRLPAIGVVRMREELRFAGDVCSVTLSERAGRWFASFIVDDGQACPPLRTGDAVGIDMGVKTLAFLSDGTQYENPKPLKAALAALRRIDKAIARSRNTHGKNRLSQRRLRLYAQRTRLHARIANIRQDRHHKTVNEIVNRYAVVKVETLKVANMAQNRRLSRALLDAGIASFVLMLEQKAKMSGTKVEKVSQWFASSQICSGCGERKVMPLSVRKYACSACGLLLDRDHNAAINILHYTSVRSTDDKGRGAEIRPPSPLSEGGSRRETSTQQPVRLNFGEILPEFIT